MLTALVAFGLLLVGLWIVAILDLIRATNMDPTGRMILALVLIFVAPIGILLWLGVRGGPMGAVLAVAFGVLVSAVIIVIAAGVTTSRPIQVMEGGAGPIEVSVPHQASPVVTPP